MFVSCDLLKISFPKVRRMQAFILRIHQKEKQEILPTLYSRGDKPEHLTSFVLVALRKESKNPRTPKVAE